MTEPLPSSAILAREDAARDMIAALRELREWADMMGGWDAPCWRNLDKALDRAKAAGIQAWEQDE